jgi:hypothetical protein
MGDFNAYTKQLNDCIACDIEDHNESLDVFDDADDLLEVLPRYSQDTHRVNNYGYRLLDICKAQSLVIFNGRLGDDVKIGRCTSNGCSVVDYVIGSFSLFPCVKLFSVDPFDAMLSDVHCPVILTLMRNTDCSGLILQAPCHTDKICGVVKFDVSSGFKKSVNCINKWDNSKLEMFKSELSSIDINEIHHCLDDENVSVSDANKKITSVLLQAAKLSLGCRAPYQKKVSRIKNQKPWFNANCRQKRRSYFKARRKCRLHNSSFNRHTLMLASKEYKLAIRSAERNLTKQWHKDLRKLKKCNSKEYWRKVNSEIRPTCPISLDHLYDHFQSLNSEKNCDDANKFDIDFTLDYDMDVLNAPISQEEVNKALNRLKSGKSPGDDLIRNEYLKNSSHDLSVLYCKLFNKVLDTGVVPDEWTVGLILPLYKGKGDKCDCDNYRGITLLSCLGKLFTSILNDRLTLFLDDNNLLSENQAGFRKSHSTLDHAFALKAVCDIFRLANKKNCIALLLITKKPLIPSGDKGCGSNC